MMIGGAGASPPDAPTIGTATGGNASASVTFSAPANNGGSAITGFTVTSSPSGITGTGASSPITVSGLSNGTAYTFTVTATNAIGTSPASSASNSVTPANPSANWAIYMIGAGGGGNEDSQGTGGFGGFGHVTFTMTGSLSLSYVAGTGGNRGTSPQFADIGGGGRASGPSQYQGNGGGYSRLSGTGFDIVCGGGGGSGYGDVGGIGAGPGFNGATGWDWSCGGIGPYGPIDRSNNNSGKGGSPTAGGAGGSTGSSTAGSSLQGGGGITDGTFPGGGGGGGKFGGGSGGQNDGCGGGPGGGGGGFYSITNGNITSATIVARTDADAYTQSSGTPDWNTIFGTSAANMKTTPCKNLTIRGTGYASILSNGSGDSGAGNGTNAYHGVQRAGGHGEIVIYRNGSEYARYIATSGTVTLSPP